MNQGRVRGHFSEAQKTKLAFLCAGRLCGPLRAGIVGDNLQIWP